MMSLSSNSNFKTNSKTNSTNIFVENTFVHFQQNLNLKKDKLALEEKLNSNKIEVDYDSQDSSSFLTFMSIPSNGNSMSSKIDEMLSGPISPRFGTPINSEGIESLVPPNTPSSSLGDSVKHCKKVFETRKYFCSYNRCFTDISQSQQKEPMKVLNTINIKSCKSPSKKKTPDMDEENIFFNRSSSFSVKSEENKRLSQKLTNRFSNERELIKAKVEMLKELSCM